MTDSESQTSKILVVFAHAYDETLLAGALIVKLVSDGNNVTVLCLAPGDDDRTSRLHKACEVLWRGRGRNSALRRRGDVARRTRRGE